MIIISYNSCFHDDLSILLGIVFLVWILNIWFLCLIFLTLKQRNKTACIKPFPGDSLI